MTQEVGIEFEIVSMLKLRDQGPAQLKAAALGRKLEIAIAIGNHPTVMLAAQMHVRLDDDEFDIGAVAIGATLTAQASAVIPAASCRRA